MTESNLPVATQQPRGGGWVWLVPLAALALAGALGWQTWNLRGTVITIQLQQGHGLKNGAALRYRGTDVGAVQQVELLPGLGGLVATLRLEPDAEELARVGSRFWVVHPQLGWTGIEGLETIIGARYLAVLPGKGTPQRHFVGLENAPLDEALLPGLDITLLASRRAGLAPGSPVTYRDVRIGSVLSADLSSDASDVVVRVRILPSFAPLVRERTHFWITGGVDLDVSLTGISLELDSLAGLLLGGISVAVPPDAGEPVDPGHRFALHTKADEDWQAWRPAVSVGHSLLPVGASPPTPLRATLSWTEGWILDNDEHRTGWVLAVPGGLLGPADLLRPPENAHDGSAVLEVAGESLPMDIVMVESGPGLLRRAEANVFPQWRVSPLRAPEEPEDCVVFGDPDGEPISLSPSRFEVDAGAWRIDSSLSLDRNWHGAAVLARADGALIGMLTVDEDDVVRVVPLTE